MTEKQKDKLHKLNLYIWFMVDLLISLWLIVALLSGLRLFADLIYYFVQNYINK
jgi:hypothetical protein